MAGGKETPRQKMIGMMYLVLTALLALNVSKEIISAFVTINDKLESSGELIHNTTDETYHTFEEKRLAIKQEKGDTKIIDFWQERSDSLNQYTREMIDYILSESNHMISKVEGKDWVLHKDDKGRVTELESLRKIQGMDNFDIPTEIFVGGNLKKPNDRGLAILTNMHKYRDKVAELMGNYSVGKKKYTFDAPEDISGLTEALATANPEDTSTIAQFYKSITLPDNIEVSNAGKKEMQPWPSAMFYQAPVVAAAAMFTTLKLDVLNGENRASEFMLSKVDAPTFNFNKIEAMPFAKTGYVNAGDSLDLKVMIAAYDSNEIAPLKYGINDSLPINWKNTTGDIKLDTDTPGNYRVTGAIGVKRKGETVFEPWDFNYTVGKPSGTISLPEMNVLYRGYNNKVEGAASGFPNYSLSGAGNVSMSKSGDGYIAKPGGAREATIVIYGMAEDGSQTSLGKTQFRVMDLPKPSISLGRIKDGETAPSSTIRSSRRLFAGYPPEIPLKADFSIVSWEASVSGAPRPAKGNGANLTSDAMRLFSNAPSGSMITIVTRYKDPSGKIKRQNAVFTVQ